MQRQSFSPRTKGQYHKAVGFAKSGGEIRSEDSEDETPVVTKSTEDLDAIQCEGESDLIGNEQLLKTLRELESIRALRGANSRGVKDGGVGYPPRNRVKKDREKTMIDDMYQGVGYSTKKGFINI